MKPGKEEVLDILSMVKKAQVIAEYHDGSTSENEARIMYKIKLDQFEGPLDLLLFFIKRDELNIYDIPISKLPGNFLIM
jgi:hypothetical protein